MDLKKVIREIPDFPKPGVNFKDISTLIKSGPAFHSAIEAMAAHFEMAKPDIIVGPESRGFVIGAPVAFQLGCGFIMVRKPGKLPAQVEQACYELEYGKDSLEIHRDAIIPGQKVLIVDDLLATGGTILAVADLVKKLGGQIAGFAFIIELDFLKGRERLAGYDVQSLVHYESE